MCGRFIAATATWAEYAGALSIIQPPLNLEPNLDVRPTNRAPIVRLEEGERRLALARWGLIPRWWDKPLSEMKLPSFNARAETAGTKPFFRAAVKDRRCLVPTEGFYEWTGPKGARVKYVIRRKDGRFLVLAGLWERAMVDGETVDSFTILTEDADPGLAAIHDRQPIALTPDVYDLWLSGKLDLDSAIVLGRSRPRAWSIEKA